MTEPNAVPTEEELADLRQLLSRTDIELAQQEKILAGASRGRQQYDRLRQAVEGRVVKPAAVAPAATPTLTTEMPAPEPRAPASPKYRQSWLRSLMQVVAMNLWPGGVPNKRLWDIIVTPTDNPELAREIELYKVEHPEWAHYVEIYNRYLPKTPWKEKARGVPYYLTSGPPVGAQKYPHLARLQHGERMAKRRNIDPNSSWAKTEGSIEWARQWQAERNGDGN